MAESDGAQDCRRRWKTGRRLAAAAGLWWLAACTAAAPSSSANAHNAGAQQAETVVVSAISGGNATVTTAQGSRGDYLVDPHSRTLYLLDPGDGAVCGQMCIARHPPFVTSGDPSAGDGTNSNLLGVIHRPDGTQQVSYGGHPLYYYSGDSAAGEITGEGVDDLWWMVTPQGTPIKVSYTSSVPR